MKFNSGVLIELFTKISTHKNNPLYGRGSNNERLTNVDTHNFYVCKVADVLLSATDVQGPVSFFL